VTAAQGPVPQIRTMAIVHVSVHDAVNAITCDYRTYLSIRCGPWGAPEGAAIGAAHRALVGLLPSQASAFGAARAASLAAHGLTEGEPGVAFGEAVAEVILALRASDGSAQVQFPYTAPGEGNPGVWVSVGAAPPSAARLEECHAVGPAEPLTIPTRWSAAASQPALRA
jgi:hypothetical protein